MASTAAPLDTDRRNPASPPGTSAEGATARPRWDAPPLGPADLAAAADDAREVDARAAAIAEETGARGRLGRILARRAAAMSLRLERAEEHALVASASRARAARDEFDAGRRAALDDLIARLGGAGDPRPTLAELEGSPEGVRFLAESWVEILRGLRAGTDPGDARRRLGPDAPADLADLIGRGEAELARLRLRAVELEGMAARAIAHARHEAGVLAGFDASIEGERARRYEAAAERSMHRALRAIAAHRAGPCDLAPPAFAPAGLSQPIPPPGPARSSAAPLASFPDGVPKELGSFLAGVPSCGLDELLGPSQRRPPAPGSPEARRNRRDPARLVAARR